MDLKQHRYEILPVRDGTEQYPYLTAKGGEDGAVFAALEVLREHPEFDAVKVYHSYPSPGPLRRFCGKVLRDGELHRPA